MTQAAVDRTQVLRSGLLIGSEWVRKTAAGTMAHVNPATGGIQKEFTIAGPGEVDAAVGAARTALGEWKSWQPDRRRQALLELADLIGAHADELGTISALEGGGPYSNRGASVATSWLQYYAGWADKLHGEVARAFPLRGLDYTLPEPVGVVAVIITWNGPIGFFGMSVAPVLAAGCCVVLKAPELAPFSSMLFGELCVQAGLPAGVMNVITGGADVGDALVRHPGVDKISFTGGTATAKKIQAAAADALTPLVMELGGKSANLVFDDADFNRSVTLAARFTNANGQGCSLPTRLLVQSSIYEPFVDALLEHVERNVVVGDPFDPRTTMGPVITAAACDRILGVVERAKSEGSGRLALGGTRLDGALANGFFVAPTIFVDVDNASNLAQEEIFGPVLAVMPFVDEEHAVALANDTKYGLAAYVQTNDLRRAHRLAEALDAGNVHINGSGPGPVSPSTPFGGVKQSGYGRQGGRVGVEEFVAPKNVFVHL